MLEGHLCSDIHTADDKQVFKEPCGITARTDIYNDYLVFAFFCWARKMNFILTH